jgi:hypothetical protein
MSAHIFGNGSRAPASDDIDQGLKYVGAEVAAGRTGLYVGKGPAGFALLVASPTRFEIGSGVGIGVSMNRDQFRAFSARVLELLGSDASSGAGGLTDVRRRG